MLQVVRNLSEGAYGVVRLLVDPLNPGAAIAVKCVDLRNNDDLKDAMHKEALIHRSLRNHENVLQYIGMQSGDGDQFRLFLEYAEGGDLFAQIEPDIGMPATMAHHFFVQLVTCLEHIHSRGFVHRDIKPENLLLTKTNVLKIGDFGMATTFRHGGVERYLDLNCGTTAYAAPEVFSRRYRGPPIDVWSSGVVLVTLLTGQLPWDQPFSECQLFRNWTLVRDFTRRPWSKIGIPELSLLRTILCEDIGMRATTSRIKAHPWFVGHGQRREQATSPLYTASLGRRSRERQIRKFSAHGQPLHFEFQRKGSLLC